MILLKDTPRGGITRNLNQSDDVHAPISMAHRWHYADWEERRKRLDPQMVMGEIGLEEGEVLIDLGSGNGFFSIPAARIAGEKGRIYSIDANPDAIQFLRGKAFEENLGNVIATVGRAEETIPCEGCGDVVFFAEVLHDFQDQTMVLENAFRMLKPGGKVVNLDWKKERGEMGPPYHIRFSEQKVINLLTGAGFVMDSVEEFDAHHYIIKAHRD